jgi:hypothetical protein
MRKSLGGHEGKLAFGMEVGSSRRRQCSTRCGAVGVGGPVSQVVSSAGGRRRGRVEASGGMAGAPQPRPHEPAPPGLHEAAPVLRCPSLPETSHERAA